MMEQLGTPVQAKELWASVTTPSKKNHHEASSERLQEWYYYRRVPRGESKWYEGNVPTRLTTMAKTSWSRCNYKDHHHDASGTNKKWYEQMKREKRIPLWESLQ
jgi:hypothetical protein